MKRYFLIFLTLVVVFASFPVAVSADSFDPVMQDTVDLFSLQDNDIRIFNSSTGSYSIIFNTGTYFVGYCEFLLFTNVNITDINISGTSVTYVKNGEYYRIYSSPSNVYNTISLNITGSNTSSFLYILSAEMSSNNRSSYDINSTVKLITRRGTDVYNYTGSYLGIDFSPSEYSNSFSDTSSLSIAIPSWKLYDSISLSLDFRVASINSVTVGIADTFVVPYTVSILDSQDFDQSNSNTLSNQNRYHVKIDIDLRDFNLTNTSAPLSVYIDFDFLVFEDQSPFRFLNIYGIHGFIIASIQEPVIFWFRKTYKGLEIWFSDLSDKLQDIFTGREQDQVGANSFNDSINDQADELEDLTADLNSVTRPPLSDVNLSTSGMVDQSVVVLATNGIGSILSNQIILRVLIMSLTFALAGFILFGKR